MRERRPPTLAEGTKDQILDRTIFLIGKKGTTDVTVREIAREAGVNVAAVNYYFSSKEQMFSQMSQRFLDGYDQVMGLLKTPGMSAEQRLRQWADEVMRNLADYPGIIAVMERLASADPLDPFSQAIHVIIRRAVRQIRTTLCEFLGSEDEERVAFKLTLLISALAGPFPHNIDRSVNRRGLHQPAARGRFLDLLLQHLRQ